ncbi:Uma2 family endonuclease [Gloeobacter morelensis]|uniref:Uma2 family endonuclease n=1 Tax=Gloeobacter morelensis TaxID=2907343 RepID=UPI003AB96C51
MQARAAEADFRRLARQIVEELGTPDSRFQEPLAAAVAARFCAALYQWVEPRRLGEVLCSPSLRLVLNDDDYLILTPHVAFISRRQLQQLPSQELLPKLAAVVLSGLQPSAKRMRLEILMEYGVQVGLLLDPQSRTVTVYREAAEPRVLQDQDLLTVEDLFPGWEVHVFRFWPPVAAPE